MNLKRIALTFCTALMFGCGASSEPAHSTQPLHSSPVIAYSAGGDGACEPKCDESARCGAQDGCGGSCMGECGKPGMICVEDADSGDRYCADSRLLQNR